MAQQGVNQGHGKHRVGVQPWDQLASQRDSSVKQLFPFRIKEREKSWLKVVKTVLLGQ